MKTFALVLLLGVVCQGQRLGTNRLQDLLKRFEVPPQYFEGRAEEPMEVREITGNKYIGCYEDDSSRLLPNPMPFGRMSVEKCVQNCSYSGYSYAGVQYANQCWCGNYIKTGYTKYSESMCSTACDGDSSQKCGGTWRISIYSTYAYLGCHEDKSTRILDGEMKVIQSMTTAMCVDFCRTKNRAFAGTQYAQECFCGDRIKDYQKKPNAECNYLCKGKNSESCGGFWRISLYRV